ncbi:MAG TPA: ABC transporter ATP-binding protein [Blastocatellia bacterium]|nr:ABC transporter ATP-binding protein [Blastocatellia bacterium]
MREATITAEEISVTYGAGHTAVRALDKVNLRFRAGEMALVMGPSGSGKTTLLSVVGCLLTPDAGNVSVMGRPVTRLSEAKRGVIRQHNIGYIFQAFRLFHSLNAIENVTIALEISGRPRGEAKDAAMTALDSVGLADKLRLKPNELSGGEKQRVAIARALVNDPPIILADEPTASLDSISGSQIAEMLMQIAQEQQRLVIVVSHDPRIVQFGSRIVKMQDGRVTEDVEVNNAFAR